MPLDAALVSVTTRAGVPATRTALIAYSLTSQGVAELFAMLDTGAYTLDFPKEAALLVADAPPC